MSTQATPQPAEPQGQAANDGVPTELSAEALQNLTGWFDVLIQMDLEQKRRNEIEVKDATDLQDTQDNTQQVN
jgi:hypothetical protein